MAIIKQRHQDIIEKKLNTDLLGDMGRDVIIHQEGSKIDCVWCKFDNMTGRSSGIPESGKTWSTHSNYRGTNLICPNCLGKGTIESDSKTTIKALYCCKHDLEIIDGKLGRVDRGKMSLTGKLTDVNGDSELNNILLNSIKVVIENIDYRVINFKKIGLISDFSFEAILERLDRVDLPSSGVLTS